MRKRFEQNPELGTEPIGEIVIPLKTRHELPPVLAGLQHIFNTPQCNEAVFSILEEKVLADKRATGRNGMDLWEILVLAVVRLCVDANYDELHHMANYDGLLRGILGVATTDFSQGKVYGLSTIKDNVRLLDEDTIERINLVVVAAGHRVVKKKGDLALNVKADSYVLESNVHFPTDLNLLLDSNRKCIDILGACQERHRLPGWRKHKDWLKRVKDDYRKSSKACWGGGKNKEERVRAAVAGYLATSRELEAKVDRAMKDLPTLAGIGEVELAMILLSLDYYRGMARKHIDLVERRLIKGETIPHAEKLFSIFEDHAEWIKKGKSNNRVEIGHKVLIATDQYHFILRHKVMVRQEDVEVAEELARDLVAYFPGVASLSLDRGFYSLENKIELKGIVPVVNLPKKGKRNMAENEEEGTKEFKKLRKSHSAVESNINQLESNGLNTCPDKRLEGFKRYAGLGVLAYNFHRLGTYLQKAERKKEAVARKRQRKMAA